MQVIAKFYCEAVTESEDGSYTTVTMRPDFPKDDNPDHPNRTFWEATPSGHLSMCITNKTAADVFEQGAVYTVTFGRD